jgi:hypothetical protein
MQVDLTLRGGAYYPGWPQCNVTYNPDTSYGGNRNHYLITGPQYAASYMFHEEGHGYLFSKLPGEVESVVNLAHVAIWHQGFGYDLDYAFAASRGQQSNSYRTIDNAAVVWMTSFNFVNGNEMSQAEKQYQLPGHAKFANIARMFSWQVLNDYFKSFVDYYEATGITKPFNNDTDEHILRLCIAADCGLTSFMYFWGIHPDNPSTLASDIATENLTDSTADRNTIYDQLYNFRRLVPENNAEFQAFASSWWGRVPQLDATDQAEREHAQQWDSYDESSHAAIVAMIDSILSTYFPGGDPDPDLTAPTPDPMTWASLPAPGFDATSIHEMENGLISGARIASGNAGYTGTGYVDYQNSSGDYVELTVNMPVGGTFDISYRYALASGDRPLEIQVNGQVVDPSLSFPATGSWTTWGYTATIPVTLNAGDNAIRATAIGSSGANVDHLLLEGFVAPDTAISMTATTATDPEGVEYYFAETSGNPGGDDSGWQDSPVYTDAGLSPGTEYTYLVKARDESVNQNEGAWSAPASATTSGADTDPPTPNPATFASAPAADSDTAISMTATTGSDASSPVEYYFDETSGNPGGSDSGWQASSTYTDTGLSPSTQYTYTVQMRDSLANTGTASAPANATTLPAAGSGTGLKGDYYDNMDFTAFALSRTDATVNFDWGSGSPDPSIAADTFSVRWTGQVEPLFSETYTFKTTSDDGVRLWVNGQQIIDNWTTHAPTDDTGNIVLSAGVKYDITLEYFENGGGAVIKLYWSSASQSEHIIPQTQLYPSAADTAPPTPDPATFASPPAADSSSAISMTATTGTDATGPVEYYFDETSGNPGGTDSGWQTSPSYTDTGLTASTQYTYTVTMRDAVTPTPNVGTPSSPANATTQAPPDTDPPTPNPATFAVPPAADSDTAISMTATTGSDASGPVEYYFDEISGNPGGSDSGWQTSPSYTDSGLTPSTQYTYTVQMRDAVTPTPNIGTASSPASATTNPAPAIPAAPSNLSATAIARTQIDLVWTDNADNETGFKIERSKRVNTNFSEIATVGADVTSFSDTTAKKNTLYYYRVRATNSAGDSDYSNEASAKTPK